MTENGRLRVETLGPLRVYAGAREIALGPPKQRAVFAVLALSDNSLVPRDDLIDRLWGAEPPATAVGSVHTYVSGLRRALAESGDPLTSTGAGYLLPLDPEGLDARVAERLAARARADRERAPAAALDAYDRALACWRSGSVLGGLPGPFAVEYRAWASDLRLRLLMERAELLLGLDRPTGVADGLRAQVAAHPYDERLRALLMTALSRSGRTADALAQYRHLRTVLAEDLGIAPSAELRDLNSSILAENGRPRTPADPRPPAAAPVVPAQLPHGVGAFVGRAEPVGQVLEAARTAADGEGAGQGGVPGIVMIVGVGGIGKTALAVHCAHRLADAYPDGQLYLNLRGFDPKQPVRASADSLHHLLTSLNVTDIPAGHEQRAALWRSIVRDKRMLIVLDNADSAERVEDLLPGAGPSFTIVTSRNRLSGLAVRHSARRVTLPPFSVPESLELLSASIGSGRVGAELGAARRLAGLCDGLPLALRIASEQATAGPSARIADLVADLEDVRHRLDALQMPDDELYSVRGVLSWSYARLDTAGAHAFRTLGLLPGPTIRPEATAALLDLPVPAAAAALRNLAAQHLVETAGTGYRMHELTRLYAEELCLGAETDASRRRALERLLHWYVEALTPDRPGQRPTRYVPEWDDAAPLVRTAQRIGRHTEAWQLARLLHDRRVAAGQSGDAGDWVRLLRTGLRSAELLGDKRAQALLLHRLSAACSRLGDDGADRGGTALRRLREALALARADGDTHREGLALFGLAQVHGATGASPVQVRDLAVQALARLRESGTAEAAEVSAFLGALDAGPRHASERDPVRRAG
ncbi:AfsR/SARP family transcriptional regulator [Streptomyces sp. NPDC096198]|uniref:AfsR/SARP family transcriptional regulator n=1 Tax=Streptomyces sp. NPDC096198 TaxID=3366080 RepID=UPI003810292F